MTVVKRSRRMVSLIAARSQRSGALARLKGLQRVSCDLAARPDCLCLSVMAELFTDLDLDARAPRGRRMLRTLGGSLALHLLFVLCLIYVPAVRDTFQLASALSGLRVVDEAYTQTEVREQIIFIKATDRLYYPAGYFDQTGTLSPLAPAVNDVKLISEYKPPKPIPTPRVKPTRKPQAAPSPAASPELAQNEQSKAAAPAASPGAAPSPGTPKTTEEAEKVLQEAKQDKFPPINTRPFTDLLQKGKEMKDAGEIDLSGTLEMSVEADRRDDGTLTNVEIVGGAASDVKLKDLAKAFVAALSDSKVLAALKDTNHLRMSLLLDEQNIAVRVVTEVTTEEQAQQMSRGYQGLILIGALSKKGRDEEAIFKNIRVTAAARQIVLGFTMPRKDAGDLLSKLSKKNEPGPST